MSRVLVTGGAGGVVAAVVRRLLADPAYEVRVSDERPASQWVREGCEVHQGDLRQSDQALAAMRGCTHVVHLAPIVGGIVDFDHLPHTLTELNNALDSALIRAAVDLELERFVYVSSSLVFERAELFPTPEDHLYRCPAPVSTYGFSKLTGEVYCRAANEEHGLRYTICRPFSPYGPGDPAERQPGTALAVRELIGQALAGRRPLEIFGSSEQTRTLTHLDDIADGIVVAMGSAAALNEDFNISASRELSVTEIARIIWDACGADPDAFAAEYLPGLAGDVKRRWPSVEKARSRLGWEARIEVEEGLAATVRWMRGQRSGAAIARSPASRLSGAPLS